MALDCCEFLCSCHCMKGSTLDFNTLLRIPATRVGWFGVVRAGTRRNAGEPGKTLEFRSTSRRKRKKEAVRESPTPIRAPFELQAGESICWTGVAPSSRAFTFAIPAVLFGIPFGGFALTADSSRSAVLIEGVISHGHRYLDVR